MIDNTVPTIDSLGKVLVRVFGSDPIITPVEPYTLEQGYLASYIRDDAKTCALCIADPGMVAFSGSAFLHKLPDNAHKALTARQLPVDVVESYREIANILTRVLSSEDGDRVRLDDLFEPDSAPPSLHKHILGSVPVCFYIEVPRYGTGALSFYTNLEN